MKLTKEVEEVKETKEVEKIELTKEEEREEMIMRGLLKKKHEEDELTF